MFDIEDCKIMFSVNFVRKNILSLLILFALASLLIGVIASQSNFGAKAALNEFGVEPEVENAAATDAPRHYKIEAKNLPKPYATDSASNGSQIVAQPKNAALRVPDGFKVNLYAEDFDQPRIMTLAPNGDVFVVDSGANKVIVLRDKNADGKPDERFVFTDDLNQPFGLAFHDGYVYIANTDSVVRFVYQNGQTKAVGRPEKIIDLPGKGYNQHWTRNLIFSPDGKKLYVTVGSASNVSAGEDERRAAINEYDADGKNHRIYAAGLRNPVGLAWNPINNQLWTAVNERDGLGNELVPDYATSVKENAFYGWPFAYIGQNEDPRRKNENPDLIKKTIAPDVLIQAHSAALGIQFYTGKMFPAEYRNNAFVALHGSWNREKLTGYKIIRIKFDEKGNPLDGGYDDFLTGWLPDENSEKVWGRPVGLLILNDGSMLISDDGAARIWRVYYQK